MARIKKASPTLDSILFNTAEQKVIRFLVSQPTTSFTPRVISSKLKGVRGLGGADGITKIMTELQDLKLVEFVDNQRSVRIQDENPTVKLLKTLITICDLEGLKILLEPVSQKGFLFGSRATGKSRTDSDYDLFIVAENAEEITKVASRHPLGRNIELITWTPDDYLEIEQRDPELAKKLSDGIQLWGTAW